MLTFLKCLLPIFTSKQPASKPKNFVSFSVIDAEELESEKLVQEDERPGRPIRAMPEIVAEALIAPCFGVHYFELIGSGTFSKVYKARDANKKVFGVKIQSALRNDRQTLTNFYKSWAMEVQALQVTAGHRNFVQVDQVHYWKHIKAVVNLPTHMAIKMEYLPIDVKEIIEMNSALYQGEGQLRNLLVNHLEAISFLHSKCIIHHDLKTSNSMLVTVVGKHKLEKMPAKEVKALLHSVGYKLIDMGLAELVWRNWSSRNCGCLTFMAPEKLEATMESNQKGPSPLYNPYLADAYSIGCIVAKAADPAMFDQLMGRRSMKNVCVPSEEASELVFKVSKLNVLQGTDLLDVVLGLLDPSPTKRFTVQRALQMLK